MDDTFNEIDLCKEAIISMTEIIDKLNNKINIIEEKIFELQQNNNNNEITTTHEIIENDEIIHMTTKNIEITNLKNNNNKKIKNNEIKNNEIDNNEINDIKKKLIKTRRKIVI